jgi:hypothetical protein
MGSFAHFVEAMQIRWAASVGTGHDQILPQAWIFVLALDKVILPTCTAIGVVLVSDS